MSYLAATGIAIIFSHVNFMLFFFELIVSMASGNIPTNLLYELILIAVKLL